MHIPTLENVYETLGKQHAILLKEKEKISRIKQKLGIGNADGPKQKPFAIKSESL